MTMEVVSDTMFSGNRTELEAKDYIDSDGISVDAKEQTIRKRIKKLFIHQYSLLKKLITTIYSQEKELLLIKYSSV